MSSRRRRWSPGRATTTRRSRGWRNAWRAAIAACVEPGGRSAAQGQPNREGRALARGRRDVKAPAVGADDLVGDVEAEAEAIDSPPFAASHLKEAREHVGQVRLRNADAIVAHLNLGLAAGPADGDVDAFFALGI